MLNDESSIGTENDYDHCFNGNNCLYYVFNEKIQLHPISSLGDVASDGLQMVRQLAGII